MNKKQKYSIHQSGDYYEIRLFGDPTVFVNVYRVAPGFGWGCIRDGELAINADVGAFTAGYKSPNKTFPTIRAVIEELDDWFMKKVV